MTLYNLTPKETLLDLANLQYTSIENINAVCEERLQQQIFNSSDSVKKFFGLDQVHVGCLADLKKLPIRTAHDVWQTQLKSPPFGIYNGYPFDQIRSSKGSTGFQKFWPFTNHAWSMFMIGKVRMLQAINFTSDDLLASLDTGSTPLGIKTTVDTCSMCFGSKILPVGTLSIHNKVDLILKFNATAIVGTPDAIVNIGKLINQLGKLNPVKKIISVGKAIQPYYQDLTTYFPSAVIQNDIGSSELSQLVFTCSAGSQHVNIDLTYVDLDNTGDIIATGLTSANPLFNYKTGDKLSNLRYSTCKCGSCLPIVDTFIERPAC